MITFSKRILFTVTGFFIYYLFSGLPLSYLMNRICPIEHVAHNQTCFSIYGIACLIALFGLVSGLSLKEFHRTGKWFWGRVIPSFVEA